MATKKRPTDNSSEEMPNLSSNNDNNPLTVDVQVIESTINPPDEQPPQPTDSSKPDPEATIADLRQALEQSHQREYALSEQIYQLKSDLYEQKNLVQTLQQNLAQSNVKTELEQVKKTALELAEANTKLIEEVTALRNPKEKEKEKEKPKEKEIPKTIAPIVPKKTPQRIEKRSPIIILEPRSESPDKMWLLD